MRLDLRQPINHWTTGRKQFAVQELRLGRITSDELRRIHGITAEEIQAWQAGKNYLGNGVLRQPVKRWTPNRKQHLVEAYLAGRISAEEIARIHGISQAELDEWVRRNGNGGAQGLYFLHTKAPRPPDPQ